MYKDIVKISTCIQHLPSYRFPNPIKAFDSCNNLFSEFIAVIIMLLDRKELTFYIQYMITLHD